LHGARRQDYPAADLNDAERSGNGSRDGEAVSAQAQVGREADGNRSDRGTP
jgi:hypothetical protein